MISKIKSSFRLRLTLSVLLAIIIPIIVILSFISILGVQRIAVDAKSDMKTQADVLTNAIVSWDDRARLAVLNLSEQPSIRSMNGLSQRASLRSMSDIYPDMYLIHTVDTTGENIARSDLGLSQNYADREWFQRAMAGSETIIRQALIGRTTGEPSIAYSSPILTREGEISGATLAVSSLETLVEYIATVDLGETGFAYLVNEDGIVLAHPDPAYTTNELVDISELPPVTRVLTGQHGHFEYTDEDGVRWFTHLEPLDNGWGIVVQQEQAEAMSALPQFIVTAITISLVLLLVIGLLTWLVAGRAIRPISTLTTAATAVAGGNLNETVEINQTDEIGVLADAFNSMTERLSDLVNNLELRVADQMQDLNSANEIGRTVSTIRDTNQLLAEAVKIIHDAFNLYLVQIYLVEDDQETLLLQAAEGQAANRLLAQGHFLAISTASINGTAVAEKRAVVVSNTAEYLHFRPNPLLPDTRSEMAVPLMVADKVLGVLDVQSSATNTFTEENVTAFTTMAGQLAIALENASFFNENEKTTEAIADILSETERQAQRLTALNEMGANLAAATKLDEVYQIISTQILTLIDGDRASIALTTEAGDSIEVYALQGEKGAIPTGSVLPFTGTAIGLAIQENRMVQLPKESPLSTFGDSRQLAQQGLQSIFITPLNASGHTIGTLNIGSLQAYAFSRTDINFVQQIATLLATTIDSMNLVNRVQNLASIVESHPDAIGIGAMDGIPTYINPAGRTLLGLTQEDDVTQMNTADFYIQEDAERFRQEGIPAAIEAGSWTTIAHIHKPDGSIIPVEQTIAIIYGNENQAINFSITMHDITKRQADEVARQRLNTQLEERLLQVNAMQRAITHEGWSAFLTSDNRLVQGFKFGDNKIGLISTRDLQKGDLPQITQPESESDALSDTSKVAEPVQVRGDTIGVIGAQNPDGTPLTAEQKAILSAMTQQVANALDRARLFEEMELAREQMNSLYSGSERVIRASSINEVLVALVESTKLRRMDTANFLFFDKPWEKTIPETMTIAAVWEKVPGFTPEKADSVYQLEQFPSMKNLSETEPTLFYDVATDERAGPDAKELAELLNVKSVFYFPLIVANQWFGLLSAKATNAIKLSDDDIKQITGLVDQAATVSQTQRLFTQTQDRARREQLLREVSAKVYAAPDAETIMKTAVKEVNRIMGVDSFVYLDDPTSKQPPTSNGHSLETDETAGQEG